MRRIIPRLLRRRAVSEMLNLYRLLHPIRLLNAQIARVVRTLRAELVVLRHWGRDDRTRALLVKPLHLVVFAELCGLTVGLDIENEGEERGEAV